MNEEKKRLYKDVANKKLAGVCAGLAKYFDIDVTLVRLAWILFVCLGGSGLLAYILAAWVMPEMP